MPEQKSYTDIIAKFVSDKGNSLLQNISDKLNLINLQIKPIISDLEAENAALKAENEILKPENETLKAENAALKAENEKLQPKKK